MLVHVSFRIAYEEIDKESVTQETVMETGLGEDLTPDAVAALRQSIACEHSDDDGPADVRIVSISRLDYPERDHAATVLDLIADMIERARGDR